MDLGGVHKSSVLGGTGLTISRPAVHVLKLCEETLRRDSHASDTRLGLRNHLF